MEAVEAVALILDTLAYMTGTVVLGPNEVPTSMARPRGDHSGIQVDISDDGNTLAIGARRNDGNGENAGHVRIYDWN